MLNERNRNAPSLVSLKGPRQIDFSSVVSLAPFFCA